MSYNKEWYWKNRRRCARYSKAYRKKNWARIRAREKKLRDKYYAQARAEMDAAKAVPCADCGGTFPPECMDFDHVRGEKRFTIGAQGHRGPNSIRKEIAKCEVVCANCHRIRTRKRKRGVWTKT